MAFAWLVTAGFGAMSLWTLGMALNYRGWGTQQVERVRGWRFNHMSATFRYATRNNYDPDRIHRRYVRWFDFFMSTVAAYCCVWLVVQIVTGSGT
jgi:hypothetical protein